MLRMEMFIAVALLVSVPVFSAEDHSDASKKGAETSSERPASEKKAGSLYEKLSACLNERPGAARGSSEEEQQKVLPSSTEKKEVAVNSAPPVQNPEILFKNNCGTCHAVGGSQGPISDWALAAERVGSDMPPGPRAKQIPAAEVQQLKEFFLAKAK